MSSPHARGSSRGCRRRAGARRVVPARAGVIRPPGTGCTRPPRRPRTRGGHPAVNRCSMVRCRSSPHARGSSGRPAGHPDHAEVVPARAGVIPPCPRCTAAMRRRPRTRGGHPGLDPDRRAPGASSPHARGSSPGPLHQLRELGVVPARAGVIRRQACPWRSMAGRPRTRGGHPACPSCGLAEDASSPHARGSSPRGCASGAAPTVVPARAGVIPGPGLPVRGAARRPRTRGGHPSSARPAGCPVMSSPHARGSSPHQRLRTRACRVVPARAGVIPWTGLRRSSGRGRPRTRGGHPNSATRPLPPAVSSPHARGSSRGRWCVAGVVAVVPARAGVIRAPSSTPTP